MGRIAEKTLRKVKGSADSSLATHREMEKLRSTLKRCRAFTLVELLIVIVVLAVLAAIVIPKFADSGVRSKESSLRSDLVVVRNAIDMFKTDTGAFPAALTDLSGAAAPASVAGLTFVAWQQPIGCGGVAIFPDDVIMVDDDGAVVIPQKLVTEVAALAADQERMEEWIMNQVNDGASLPGLYPPNAENKARYEAWAKAR